jgi:exonuclease VII large subunit
MAFAADGSIVTDAAQLSTGDALTLHLSRGAAAVRVQALLPALGSD